MPDTPTPETLRRLEARLRQLFADLGVPADEAVERRGDELAALLDTAPPALTREPAEAPTPAREEGQ